MRSAGWIVEGREWAAWIDIRRFVLLVMLEILEILVWLLQYLTILEMESAM